MKKINFEIIGMHCASCSANIERSLKKTKGVKEARVNLMARKGFADVEDNVSEKYLKEAVSRVGNYKAMNFRIDGDGHHSGKKGMEHEEHHGHEEQGEHNLMQTEDTHHHEEPVEESEIKSWKKKMFWVWVFTLPIAFLMFSRLFILKTIMGNLFSILKEIAVRSITPSCLFKTSI